MRPKASVVLFTVLAAAGALTHLRMRSAAAPDAPASAWGATDPTWSPDGRRLAFTLFGSIWQVAVDGGEARQVSTSAGYHAHPAWSPKGDTIAFVSGNPPAGRLPNIAGQLRVVNVDSGSERDLTTPLPLAGPVAWSPDASRLATGLLVPNAGSLLHEIRLSDGAVNQLQFRMQRGAASPWADVSWNPRRDEVFFAAQRTSAPQIWSMPSSRPPVMIQLPLTRYRPSDIVQLHSLSALPDGSGAVYSAVVVNGRGNHELYRVGRQGGAPVALTNTERDEFAPAVSPDGGRIAHVSNHLGNIDIFLMPAGGGAKTHVKITGLKFRGPSGRLRVKVLDETGQPTRARLHNVASDQKSYAPDGRPIFYQPLDASGPRTGFFLSSGEDEFPVPAGRVQVTVVKGVEYRLADRAVEVAAGETATVTIQMERWTNWGLRGWYTGENHFHANYNGSYYQVPRDSLAWLEAEDLNTANMIVANSEGAFVHDKEFFRGAVEPLRKPRYVLYWGQEYRNSDPLGHMAFLNIKTQVPPSFTSVIGSNSPYDFPLNTMAAIEARKQGGLVSYVHPISPATANDVFDTNLGAKEAPLTAALGGMDAIDVLPRAGSAYDMWYALLNSGFHILPGAGTDVFTNWRGVNGVPGGSRQYVEVGGAMDWDRWLARYREGRAFVTNGPLIEFKMNGLPPGSVFRPPKGQPYNAGLSAEITSRGPLEKVELIRNGVVIETRMAEAGATSVRIEKQIAVEQSSWFAVRATGPAARGVVGGIPFAHSAAIYVEVGNEPVLVRQDVELMARWLNRLWAYLEERNNFGPGDNRARARSLFDQGLAHYQAKLGKAR